jgi:hypothetical protein
MRKLRVTTRVMAMVLNLSSPPHGHNECGWSVSLSPTHLLFVAIASTENASPATPMPTKGGGETRSDTFDRVKTDGRTSPGLVSLMSANCCDDDCGRFHQGCPLAFFNLFVRNKMVRLIGHLLNALLQISGDVSLC